MAVVILIHLARGEGQSGDREHAVELLACIQGGPVRGQHFAAEGPAPASSDAH